MSLLVFGSTSCGVVHLAESPQDKIHALKRGMTTTEVAELMGKPDFKRFDPDTEQWKYRQAYHYENQPVKLTVIFVDDKVVAIDTDTVTESRKPIIAICPPAPHQPDSGYRNEERFDRFYDALQKEDFSDERMQRVREEAPYLHLTCRQCVKLIQLFDWEDERIRCLKEVAPNITDYHNGDLIEELFLASFDNSRRKVHKIIVNAARASKYVQIMNDTDFERFMAAFKRKKFDSERLLLLKDKEHTAFFTSAQCAHILRQYNFDSEKLEVLKVLAPMIGNFRNDDLIVDCFEFTGNKQEVRCILNKYHPAYAR